MIEQEKSPDQRAAEQELADRDAQIDQEVIEVIEVIVYVGDMHPQQVKTRLEKSRKDHIRQHNAQKAHIARQHKVMLSELDIHEACSNLGYED
jgi:hypothetical protein